jgi:MFS family permease
MFGVMVGGADVGWVNMLRESVGARRFPTIFSAWYFTQLAGLFVGPVLGGWVNDHVGSYRATLHFVLDAALVNAVLMGIFVIGINRIKSRNQSKLLS